MDSKLQLFSDNMKSCEREKEATRGIQFGYKINGVWYDATFPLSQALHPVDNTGPKFCLNCVLHEYNDELFTQYCKVCSSEIDNKSLHVKKEERRDVIDLTSEERDVMGSMTNDKAIKVEKKIVDLTSNMCIEPNCQMNRVKGAQCYQHWEEGICEEVDYTLTNMYSEFAL